MRDINVLHVEGYWSTNIGNAFYNLGIRNILMGLDKKINLYTASDLQEYYWNKYNIKEGQEFNPCEHFANMDYIICSGPMLLDEYLLNWINILHRAKMEGTKVIFLSAGGNQYTEEEKDKARKILKDFSLYALFSRDHETYEGYKDLFEYSYDGICCAFYIPEYFKPWKIDIPPYVIFNFEQYNEPIFIETEGGFEFNGNYWMTERLEPLAKRKFKRRQYPNKAFNEFNIIRTKNTCFQPSQKYYGNNIYLSDVPEDYLNIYANAAAVFSDRVHTCVGALSQGIPTMFMGNTPRANLFSRVIGKNYREAFQKLVRMDISALNAERANLKRALQEVLI